LPELKQCQDNINPPEVVYPAAEYISGQKSSFEPDSTIIDTGQESGIIYVWGLF